MQIYNTIPENNILND